MRILYFVLVFSLSTYSGSLLSAAGAGIPEKSESDVIQNREQETPENQILYNGRVWRSFYLRIRGDQFLFSSEFQPGTVTISGKLFKNLEVRYDIYSDEVLIKTNQAIILQLNKEMVNSFTMDFNNITYDFLKLEKDSLNDLIGYVNIIYKGKIPLYVKYKKEIHQLAVENKYDLFYQSHNMYIRKDGMIHQINSKNDIFSLFGENKKQIRSFIKNNNIKVTKKDPGSFVPVIDFCNSF